MDHDSFPNTLMHIFALSHLVSNNRVKLSSDPELGMIVELVDRSMYQGHVAPPSQLVVPFTMAKWESLKVMIPREDCACFNNT